MYFRCIRCFSEFKSKSGILNHLQKKTQCIQANCNIFDMSPEEIMEWSIIPIYDKEPVTDYVCSICNKPFTSNNDLEKHKNKTKKNKCKLAYKFVLNDFYEKEAKLEEEFYQIDNINEEQLSSEKEEPNNDIITVENINPNLIGFDEEWDISHIDNYKILRYLLSNNLQSNILADIRLNINNKNVIMSEGDEYCQVYYKSSNKFEKKLTKDIVRDTIIKYKQLFLNIIKKMQYDTEYSLDPCVEKFLTVFVSLINTIV